MPPASWIGELRELGAQVLDAGLHHGGIAERRGLLLVGREGARWSRSGGA